MIAVDTSVVVAAFATWHEGHAEAAAALDRDARLPAHVVLETYSVLTRLPPPHRAPAALVAAFLAEHLRSPPLTLPARAHQELVEEAAKAGLTGGSIHDALVAMTARHAGARLLTRDRRATPTYERLGASYEVI